MTVTRTALADLFDRLPEAVAALHSTNRTLTDEITVELSSNVLIAFLLRRIGFPDVSTNEPFRFERDASGAYEVWRRVIGTHALVSRLWLCGPGSRWIAERMGPLTVISEPEASNDGLRLRPQAIRLFGLPVPRPIWPRIETWEYEADGRYRFDITARLPMLGHLAFRYSGWIGTLTGP